MPYKNQNSPEAKASNKRKNDKYRGTEKSNARYKKYHELHPELGRENWYKHEHGITLVEFEAQIAAQGGFCPIGFHLFGPRGKRGDSPCQDHNHETGENRLVICRNHNVALGLFRDSIHDLESAILYLRQYEKV